jgi:hypothetical protein
LSKFPKNLAKLVELALEKHICQKEKQKTKTKLLMFLALAIFWKP